MIKLYLAVGFGGVIGAVLRYVISLLFHSEMTTTFPWATFLVNIFGAFILAFLLFHDWLKTKMSPIIFTALTTGILGSFTTFSTVMIEIVSLWQVAKIVAITYFIATFIGGISSSFLGYWCAKKVGAS